jgi:hypothetical protein
MAATPTRAAALRHVPDDVVDRVLHGANLFSFIVWNFDVELFLNRSMTATMWKKR